MESPATADDFTPLSMHKLFRPSSGEQQTIRVTMSGIILNRKANLYLGDAGHKGRGVFCKTNIKKGEVLETAPALLLNERDTQHTDKTMLMNYVFVMGDLSKKMRQSAGIKKLDHASAVIMGLMAFCNHDEKNNAEIHWEEHEGTLYYVLTALKDIPKGKEICTSYGPTWFADRTDIKKK
ncbi:MAG: SET domain-containing protein-lysine N-methyltransferase [Alphaproteobacteria bacterium]|nr:SET domain-containing protein-lysine N-methyltransferase [Alphaproteobacteria bacterium]